MNDDVLYNEPSYNSFKKAGGQYETKNNGYCNIVRYGNVKYGMIDMLRNPPKDFEDIIKVHFFLNKENIIKQCNKWLSDAQSKETTSDYTGLVSSHNYTLANKFTPNGQYYKCLKEEVANLDKLLNDLNLKKI